VARLRRDVRVCDVNDICRTLDGSRYAGNSGGISTCMPLFIVLSHTLNAAWNTSPTFAMNISVSGMPTNAKRMTNKRPTSVMGVMCP
jgi:hypothetical protein